MMNRPPSNECSISSGIPSLRVQVKVRPFLPVGVGVLRGGEAAALERELAQHVADRLLDDHAGSASLPVACQPCR